MASQEPGVFAELSKIGQELELDTGIDNEAGPVAEDGGAVTVVVACALAPLGLRVPVPGRFGPGRMVSLQHIAV